MKKIKKILEHLFTRAFLSTDEKMLLTKLREIADDTKLDEKNSEKKISIIMQMPEDYFYLIKFYLFYIVLRKKYSNVHVDLIQLSDSLFRKTKISFIQNSFLYDLKWNRIYKTLFGGRIVFNFNLLNASVDNKTREEAESIFLNYRSKHDVLSSKYKEYEIGKLVYNYYLRATSEPTVDIKSNILFEIILNTVRSISELEKIFQKNKYNYYITSYITYAAHGVPGLVALNSGARVFAFASVDQFYFEVFPAFFTQAKNYVRYKKLKNALSDENLFIARGKMEDRLSGIVDTATCYMRKSSYSYSNDTFKYEIDKPIVVIYLHCFFDSPHIYRSMIFSDFYEWLGRTLDILSKQKGISIYVKKHPGAMEGNDKIVEEIIKNFKNVKILPHDFNNIQIAKEMKPRAILTVYGTVAHEMAYLGIPVICAGDNPHIDFDFQKTPADIKEYEYLLNHIQEIEAYSEDELELIKKEVLRFYYLHNCYAFPEKLSKEEQDEHDYLWRLFRDQGLHDFIQDLRPDSFNSLIKKISNQYTEDEK
jgi:hypothetical protein